MKEFVIKGEENGKDVYVKITGYTNSKLPIYEFVEDVNEATKFDKDSYDLAFSMRGYILLHGNYIVSTENLNQAI